MKNVKVKTFLRLKENQQKAMICILQFVKGVPNFNYKGEKVGVNHSLTELNFGQVLQLKNLVTNASIQDISEAIKLVYKVDNPLNLNIIDFYKCANFIISEVKKIIKVEQERYRTLPTPYDDKLQQAGVEQLAKFGDLPLIDSLAGGDILKYKEIEQIPYLDVHFTLWYRTTKENINIQLQELTKQSTQ